VEFWTVPAVKVAVPLTTNTLCALDPGMVAEAPERILRVDDVYVPGKVAALVPSTVNEIPEAPLGNVA
jgi:hypothetical protein